MDFRLLLALVVGKIIATINKLTGSGATAAPGLYALKIDPNLVKKLTKNLKYGNIVISGTNGKTTTARLISEISGSKFTPIHNRQGSNLLRGIASTLIAKATITGKLKSNIGIWEVDEATLPEALENIDTKILLLLNLFRDQLDRYGEVDTVRKKWQGALRKLNTTTLILNSDDPGISYLAKSFKGKVIYFGVEDEKLELPEVSQVADIRHCLNCGQELNYSAVLSSHLGHYTCSKCNFKRPNPNVSATNLKFNSDFSTQIYFKVHSSQFIVHYNLPGLYNVYNILAASAVADKLKIDHTKIKEKIESFTAAFGRFQKIQIGNKSALIFLIKNPTGANEVLRILSKKQNLNVLAILNDKIADGRDVSWIWDTNWEVIRKSIKSIDVSGLRAWDLATRMKYAEIELSKNNIYMEVSYSLEANLARLNNKDTLIILPTYTAMLEVQKILSKMGATKWHKQ